jgi:hypothetical protein
VLSFVVFNDKVQKKKKRRKEKKEEKEREKDSRIEERPGIWDKEKNNEKI